MRLSDLKLPEPASILRDGEFFSLGYLNSRTASCLSCFFDDKFRPDLERNPHISCVVTSSGLAETLPHNIGVILAPDPLVCLLEIHTRLALDTDFYRKTIPTEIGMSCEIHPSAIIDSENVKIGSNVKVAAGAVIHANTTIGDDCVIRANCVVGTSGFEFKRRGKVIIPVHHAGGVSLGRRVELQAGTCVSRAVFGDDTIISDDTKTDNLVHVAHNVKIGERCLLAANAMIAGSVTIGNDVWIGPGAQISSGIIIGDRASITLGSVVTRNVGADERVSGNFAIEHSRFIEFIKGIR